MSNGERVNKYILYLTIITTFISILGLIKAIIESKEFQVFLIQNFYWIVGGLFICFCLFVAYKLSSRIFNLFQTYKTQVYVIIILIEILIIIVLIYFLGLFCPVWCPISNNAEIIGKDINQEGPLNFYLDLYDPSGKMGDIGDITIEKYPEYARFIYISEGRFEHEWEFKYINGQPNSHPAQFGGVMYLSPPNNWGDYPGWNLHSPPKSMTWEARSINYPCYVEFVIGGITWKWDGSNKTPVAYPDSMPRMSLGIYNLTNQWQTFDSKNLANLPDSQFQNIIGGFGWIITWPANQVYLNDEGTGAQNPKNFTIEIRNIRYER